MKSFALAFGLLFATSACKPADTTQSSAMGANNTSQTSQKATGFVCKSLNDFLTKYQAQEWAQGLASEMNVVHTKFLVAQGDEKYSELGPLLDQFEVLSNCYNTFSANLISTTPANKPTWNAEKPLPACKYSGQMITEDMIKMSVAEIAAANAAFKAEKNAANRGGLLDHSATVSECHSRYVTAFRTQQVSK